MFESSIILDRPALAAGPEAAVWLAGFEPGTADRGSRVDVLATVQRLAGWVAAVEARVLASFVDDVNAAAAADPDDREWIVEEVGAVLRLRGDFAKGRMLTAATLTQRLAATLSQLAAGIVSPVQTRILAEAITGLDDEACARVEARVLGRAGEQSSTQFRQSVRRAVLAAAPRAADVDHELEAATRRVYTAPGESGMGWLMAYLPVAELMTVKTAIWRLAQTRKNDVEDPDRASRPDSAGHPNTTDGADDCGGFVPIDAYRADALVELAQRYLADSDPGGVLNHYAPAIQVVVNLATLLGDDDEPAELLGYGSIPASLARLMAADPDGTWQRLVTDPLGQLIDYGTTRHEPGKGLADHIRARDRTCGFPTCNRAAEHCELDHIKSWASGGPTNAVNLTALCSRHHHLKHEGGWRLKRDPLTGEHTWTTPTGRTYTNRPPPLPGTT